MTVKSFVQFWNKQGFSIRVHAVCGELCWVFTNKHYSFWVENDTIAIVAKHCPA